VGRPLLYVTTPEFLGYMGINEVTDLPELKELAPLLEERERMADEGEANAPADEAGGEEAAAPDEALEVEVTTADGAA
jgi:hypothetical protein